MKLNEFKELLNRIRGLDVWDKDFDTKLNEIRKDIKIEKLTPKETLEYAYILRSKNTSTSNKDKKAIIKNLLLTLNKDLTRLEDEKHSNKYGITVHIAIPNTTLPESKCISYYEIQREDGENDTISRDRILRSTTDSETGKLDLKLANEFLKNQKTIKSKEDLEKAIQNESVIIIRKYNNKLNKLVDDILTDYEKDGKDVFDDFEDIYTFVENIPEIKAQSTTFHKANVGHLQHRLCGINKRKPTGETFVNNREMLEYKDKKKQAILNVPKALGGKFYPATLRTFMILTKIHTESNSHIPEFSFTIAEYMDICGLRDKKSAAELLKRDLEIITTSTLDLKSRSTIGQMNMIDKWLAIPETGIIKVRFTESYFGEIKKYPTGYISASALKLDIHKHPNSLHFEFKINQHKRSNFGKHNENIISVSTLLNGANIPDYKEIQGQSAGFAQKIVEPFERDIEALEDIFTWEYCGEKGRPLTYRELEKFSYEQFIRFNIKITWKEYPDQTKRIEKRKAIIEQIVKAKKGKKKVGHRGVSSRSQGGIE